jgi:hypothetical protein
MRRALLVGLEVAVEDRFSTFAASAFDRLITHAAKAIRENLQHTG